MSMLQWILTGIAVTMLAVMVAAPGEAKPVFRKPPPEGVTEITGIGAGGNIVELQDGSWMLATGGSFRVSTDQGETWGDSQPLGSPFGVGGMIRLQSGALGVYGSHGGNHVFASSPDEGQTWSEPSVICPTWAMSPMYSSMIQLASGRLLLTGYWEGLDAWEYRGGTMVSVHPELQYADVGGYGEWRGHRVHLEGHGHAPEMAMTVVYRSDDEGATWQKHPGGLMGWFDCEGVVNGNCGQTGCFEPTIAETKDGNVLLMLRSAVGRLVQSRSADGGEMWSAVKPSDLPSCESPALMVTLPQTGDLLIVWNQMSRGEIRRGFRRGRLSVALSRDGGHSWENFRTLELSEGLEDMDRVPPEYPLRMVRARDWVGTLPDGYARFSYPNVDVVGDKVVLRYGRGWFVEVEGEAVGPGELDHHARHGAEAVLRIYPLEYFYRQ